MELLLQNSLASRLPRFNLSEKISLVVISAEYVLCYNNFDGLHASGMFHPERFRWLPIEQSNFGDTPEIFSAVLVAGLLSKNIEDILKQRNEILQKMGEYFPEISAAVIALYYSLGETIAPYLLPGTPDINDIPSVLITALFSPVLANYLKRNRTKIASIVNNLKQ